MTLKNEIADFLNPLRSVYAFSYTVYDGVGGYFENVLKISGISTYCLTFTVKNGTVNVWGSDLKIVKFTKGDVAVKGKINKVERCPA